MNIYELLKKLIEKKYYEIKEEIQRKLDVFYAMSKIADDEYSELTLLVESNYEIKVEETEVIDEIVNNAVDEIIENKEVKENV